MMATLQDAEGVLLLELAHILDGMMPWMNLKLVSVKICAVVIHRVLYRDSTVFEPLAVDTWHGLAFQQALIHPRCPMHLPAEALNDERLLIGDIDNRTADWLSELNEPAENEGNDTPENADSTSLLAIPAGKYPRQRPNDAGNPQGNDAETQQAAHLAAQLASDAQFRSVLDAWATLPDAVKAGIAAMIAAVKKNA
jgi:hypothetical protein